MERKLLHGFNKRIHGECVVKDYQHSTAPITEIGIARGGGQSYGDSSFNFTDSVWINKSQVRPMIDFSAGAPSLAISANAQVGPLSEQLSKEGLFLEVVPGAYSATIGGCIAADVHGKNDYWYGSFGYSVLEMEVLDHHGQHTKVNQFNYIIGSNGLTGIISKVKLRLRRIPGNQLIRRVILTNTLLQHFDTLLSMSSKHDFAIGWVDLSRMHQSDYRGYVEVADWTSTIEENFSKKQIEIPTLPISFINKTSILAFNNLTWLKHKTLSTKGAYTSHYADYLFPTQRIENWNNFFGPNGFHEIQISVPNEYLIELISEISILAKRWPIFLGAIKVLSKKGIGLLSFTRPGWSVALNFPGSFLSDTEALKIIIRLFEQCDGRIYLTKDSVLTSEVFEMMYDTSSEFRHYRATHGFKNYFQSEMSKRLNI